MSTPSQRHRSEDVIINAPMSFAGAAQRSWRLRRRAGTNTPALVLITIAALLLLVAWEVTVVVWYVVVFGLLGIFMIPYRLLRRGARKRKAEALRHREVMEALQQKRN